MLSLVFSTQWGELIIKTDLLLKVLNIIFSFRLKPKIKFEKKLTKKRMYNISVFPRILPSLEILKFLVYKKVIYDTWAVITLARKYNTYQTSICFLLSVYNVYHRLCRFHCNTYRPKHNNLTKRKKNKWFTVHSLCNLYFHTFIDFSLFFRRK